jgi:TIR domain
MEVGRLPRVVVSGTLCTGADVNGETEKDQIGDLPPIHVVISYRREDTPGGAGRLRQDLGAHFGRDNVFLDIDAIPPGVDWVEEIEKTVSSSDVLLPVIGLHWLTVTDENGQRRLDDPDDVLRFEIETALKTRVRVIPIQLHGAPMPNADQLPPSLAGLTRRQSVRIDDEDWPHDVQKLVRALKRIQREKGEALQAKGVEREAAERADRRTSPSRPEVLRRDAREQQREVLGELAHAEGVKLSDIDKPLALLTQELEADEELLGVCQLNIGFDFGVLAVTSRRVLHVKGGWFTPKLREIPFKHIVAARAERGLGGLNRKLIISASPEGINGEVVIPPDRADPLASLINQRVQGER